MCDRIRGESEVTSVSAGHARRRDLATIARNRQCGAGCALDRRSENGNCTTGIARARS